MREILFRGKRVDNHEWAEGFVVKQPSAVHIGNCSPWYISIPPRDPDDNGLVVNVIPETVGQFTGMLDKHGRRIFEGDMVVSFDLFGRPDHCGTVAWSDLFCSWQMGPHVMYGTSIASYRIIGDIFEEMEVSESNTGGDADG